MITDYLILLLLFFFFINGWRRGLSSTLIGPIAFALSVFLSILIFDSSDDLLLSIKSFGLSFLVLNILGLGLLAWGRRFNTSGSDQYILFASRVTGSFVNVVWQGTISAFLLILVVALPSATLDPKLIQNNLRQSQTYALIEHFLVNPVPAFKNAQGSVEILSHPKDVERIKATEEYQDFIRHPKIQRLLADPEAAEQFQRQDLLTLINNPLVSDILNDQMLMKRFAKIVQLVYEEKPVKPETAPPAELTPTTP